MKQLHKLAALSLSDLFLLAKVSVLLLAVRLGLALLSFQRVRRILAKAATIPPLSSQRQSKEVARIVWAVTVMAGYLLGNKPCLPQALTVQLLYRQRGYPADLQIGVAKDADDLANDCYLGSVSIAQFVWNHPL